MATVTLDAGHGGHDPGAVGNGLKEKDRALDYTLGIGKELMRHGVKVNYSRDKDIFIPLQERCKGSNRVNSDLFVSIHLNGHSNATAQGFEIYHYATSGKGKALATNIHKEIINNKLYTKDRGVKSTTKQMVIGPRTNAPATLIELGFISNAEDVNLLAHKQKDIIKAITKGILKILNIAYKNNDKGSVKVDSSKPSDWALKTWSDAVSNKYTDGTRPKDNITREEAMAMIYKVLGK